MGERRPRARRAPLLALASLVCLAALQWRLTLMGSPARGGGDDGDDEGALLATATLGDAGPRPAAAWATREKCGETKAISELAQDPCYAPARRKDIRRCNCRSTLPEANTVTYYLPPAEAKAQDRESTRVLDRDTIANRLLVAFIHINKAGGSTIKRDVLLPTLAARGWDGAGLGTFQGWAALGAPWAPPQRSGATAGRRLLERFGGDEFRAHGSEPVYVRCGAPQAAIEAPTLESENQASGCPLRAIWGGMTLGLCDHFPGRPCVYLVILRDPLERAISNYNYVCIQGAEGRKKWRPEWRRQGRCPIDLREFFDVGLGEPHFLLWRLTRGCDAACGAGAAIHNLAHPCMRFLLLEELADGIARLEKELGPAFGEALREVREKHRVANAAMYDERIEAQLRNEALMRDLRERLKDDIEIYEAAKKMYSSQWERPLASCNSFFV